MCLSNGSKGINLASTRTGSRSKWHGVPKKEPSACLKIRLDRLEKGIFVFLRSSLTSRKEFPSSKESHDRARRRKRWPNCWPKYRKQTNIYIHTGSVGGQAADSQERGSLRLAPIIIYIACAKTRWPISNADN